MKRTLILLKCLQAISCKFVSGDRKLTLPTTGSSQFSFGSPQVIFMKGDSYYFTNIKIMKQTKVIQIFAVETKMSTTGWTFHLLPANPAFSFGSPQVIFMKGDSYYFTNIKIMKQTKVIQIFAVETKMSTTGWTFHLSPANPAF